MSFIKKHFSLILVGIVFSMPGEILNHLVFNKETSGWSGLFGAMAVYLVFLTIVWSSLNFLFNKYSKFTVAVVLYLLVGLVGLVIEWFVIGNSPWQNPGANQLGMFTFWGTLVLAPLILADKEIGKKFRKQLASFFLVVAVLALGFGLLSQGETRFFGILVWLYGTILLNLFYLKYFIVIKKPINKSGLV